MYEDGMIIKTRKLSPKEVKKKLRDFIDEISDDCGPEIDQMADELKEHGDAFIDAISGIGLQRGGGYYRNGGGGMNGGSGNQRSGGGMNGGGFQRGGGQSWQRDDGSMEHGKQKLQDLERQIQELRQQMMMNS